MSNANLNANSFRDKFDKTGGFLSGNPIVKNVWPAYVFNNFATGKQWQIELSDVNPTTGTDGSLYITEDGVKNHARFHPGGALDLFDDLKIYGNVTGYGSILQVATDELNAHIWFKNAAGVERALMWHESSSDQLKFRVKSSSKTMALTSEGVVYANRFVPLDTMIGVHCTGEVSGGDGGLIRGKVGGGVWTAWRDRAAGVHIDAQNSNALAHTIIKATHWGVSHLMAMDVHRPTAGGTVVKMHLGGGQEQFSFFENGQGYAAGGWHTGSDLRFKEDVFPLTNPRTKDYTSWLDKVCKLTASSFRYISSPDKRIGFIAQDVQLIIPEAVSSLKDTTVVDGEERLYVDQVAIIAAQNEAIKELKNIVDSLQSRIELLEKP